MNKSQPINKNNKIKCININKNNIKVIIMVLNYFNNFKITITWIYGSTENRTQTIGFPKQIQLY